VNNLWQWIQNATKTSKYLRVPLEQGAAFRAGETYLRVSVAEMFLEKKFAWFSTWYPAVSVSAKLTFGDQPDQIITRVVQPPPTATVTGVLRNHVIVPLMPFNGGQVELQAVLLAMQGTNFLSTAIDLLQDFSGLVGAPLAQALTVAEKVSDGLDKLRTQTKHNARLPYHDTFAGAGMGASELKSGYLALVRAQDGEGEGKVNRDRLSVGDGQLFYSAAPGAKDELFREADYILLNIDLTDKRDDYWTLKSIDKAYKDFIDALEKADEEAIAAAERSARTAVFRSDDLARFDRTRVWDAVEKEFGHIKSKYGYGAAGIPSRDLDDIVDLWGISMAQAVQKGELTLP
jgi:hypothetical protein